MQKKLSFTLSICFAFVLIFCVKTIWANSCATSDYDCQINAIQREIDALSPAHENNKKELDNLRAQIKSINSRLASLSNQLVVKQREIEGREKDLSHAQTVFDAKARMHYKWIRSYDPILPFLSSGNALGLFQDIFLKERAATSDVLTMEGYAGDLVKLRSDKDTLEKNNTNLASAKKNLDGRASFLAGEVDKIEKYLTTLDAKQEELIAAKAGGFSTSVGETPGTAEPCSGAPGTESFCDPGFRPAFAAFSFGAPHRTGMSQYGAYGRSKAGQNAETILAAYYQGASLRKDYPVPATIGISGIGRVPFEENYLLGIYEIPEGWGDKGGFEALKAQAVAARSYALAQTNNGAGNICTTEACQVYKRQLKTGKWAEAVRATRGWVIVKDGKPASTYFASTSGGYTISQWGWAGIKDASGDWPGTAFEKLGGSPWFYKGWYRSRAGKTCGKNGPWMSSNDFADIVNAWHVVYKGGGDVSRVTPIDPSCWGGNPYSQSELAGIGGYTSASSVSVVYGSNGSTQSITIGTNKGSVTINGEEFKKAFNLRAPGQIGIKSSLFNIEKL